MVTLLTPEEIRGAGNESRFFEITLKAAEEKRLPVWVLSIEQATLEQDALGIDAVATILRLDGHLVKVPIQIKSSAAYQEQHFLKYPRHWQLRVICLVVNEFWKDRKIINELIDELKHVHMHTYDFTELFREVEASNISSRHLDAMLQRRVAVQYAVSS